VAAAAGDHDAPNCCLADEAGLGFAAVDAVLELEESLFAVGIDIVRDGGAAQRYGFFQDFFHGEEKLAELFARNRRGAATRTDTGAKKRFIGINVADTSQKLLIQQGALDGGLTAVKQREKADEVDFQGFDTGSVETSGAGDAETTEAAWINEAQFPSRREFEDGVGML
jgi:hypothetical protein